MKNLKVKIAHCRLSLEGCPYSLAQTQSARLPLTSRWRAVGYLVVDGDLRVGVSLVEGLHLTQVVLLRQLHHPEQHGDLYCQRLELQLTAGRPGERRNE